MSTIDERVVEMRFDNGQFEKNIKTSLNSLDKLENALKLEGSTRGIDELQRATNKFNINPLLSAVNSVNDRFNALNVIGTTALVNITNKAISAGEALIKSLSVDNIASGWGKFEEKTKNVGTLVGQGFDLAEVEEQMERLNWFTDETSYNFTDMVNSISKFTATGKGLTESVTAMEGIALWAAASGQNATTASRAMYQLSQAMGKGVLKYDDWKSIQNASMDTIEFRQQALEAAVALGKVKKVGEDVYQIIGTKKPKKYSMADMFTSEALSQQKWFDDDVMMKVFQRYDEASVKIKKVIDEHRRLGETITAQDAIEELGDEIDELSKKWFLAGQEARTFTDVVDSVKDAVSTGWMKTFELIFGNYEEATDLFSDMAEKLYEIFAESGNVRNSILEIWKAIGGRDLLFQSLSTALDSISAVIEPFRQAVENFFNLPQNHGEMARLLFDMTNNLMYFFEVMKPTEKTIKSVTTIFTGLFSVISLVIDGIKALAYVLSPLLAPLNIFGGYILELVAWLASLVTGFKQVAETSETVKKTLLTLRNIVALFAYNLTFGVIYVAEFIKALAGMINLTGAIKTFSHYLKNLATRVVPYFRKVINVLDAALKRISDFMSKFNIKENLYNAFVSIADGINRFGTAAFNVFTKISPYIETVRKALSSFFSLLSSQAAKIQNVDILQKVVTLFDSLRTVISNVVGRVSDFVTNIGQGGSPLEFAANMFSFFVTKFTEFKDAISSFLSSKGFNNIINTITKGIDNVVTKVKEIGASRFLLFAFGVSLVLMFLEIAEAAEYAGNMFKALTTIPNLLGKTLKNFIRLGATNTFLQVAEALGILAASVKLLSTIPENDLKNSAAALFLLSIALGALAFVSSKVIGDKSTYAMNALGIAGFAGAILILAAALKLLEGVEFKHLLQSLGILTLFAAELVVVSRFLAVATVKSWPSLLLLVAFAFSINKFVDALLKLINGIKPEMTEQALNTMTYLVGFLAGLSYLAGTLTKGSAVGLLSIVISLKLMIGIMEQIKEMSWLNVQFLIDNANAIKVLFGSLVILMLITRIAGKYARDAGIGILGVAVAMRLMVGVLGAIRDLKMTKDEAYAIIPTLVGLFIGIAGLMLASHWAGKEALKAGVSMLAIAGALYLMVGLVEKVNTLVSTATPIENLDRALQIVVVFTALFGGLIFLTHFTEKVKTGVLVAVIGGIAALLAALALLSVDLNKHWDEMLKATGLMVGIMVAVGILLASLKNLKDVNAVGVGSVAAVLLIVFGTLIVLSDMLANGHLNADAMLAASIAMAVAMIGIGGMFKLIAEAAKEAKDARSGAIAILITTLALIPVAASLAMLVKTFSEVMGENGDIRLLGIAIAGLGGIMWAAAQAANIAKDALKGAFALIGVSFALSVVAVALSVLATQPWDQIAAAGLAIIGIMAVFAAIGFIVGKAEGMGKGMLILAGALGALSIVMLVMAAAAYIFASAIEKAVNSLKRLGDVSESECKTIQENIRGIIGAMGSGLGDAIVNMVTVIVEEIKKKLLPNVGETIKEARPYLKASAMGAFSGILEGVGDIFKTMLKTVWDGLKSVGSIAAETGSFIFSGIINGIKGLPAALTEIFGSAITSVIDFIGRVITTVATFIGDVFGKATELFGGFISSIADTFTTAVDMIGSFASDIIGVFTGNNSVFDIFKSSGGNCILGFIEGLESVSNSSLWSLLKAIGDGVTEVFNLGVGVESPSWKFYDSAANCIYGFVNGLQDTVKSTGLYSMVKDIGINIADIFKGILNFGTLEVHAAVIDPTEIGQKELLEREREIEENASMVEKAKREGLSKLATEAMDWERSHRKPKAGEVEPEADADFFFKILLDKIAQNLIAAKQMMFGASSELTAEFAKGIDEEAIAATGSDFLNKYNTSFSANIPSTIQNSGTAARNIGNSFTTNVDPASAGAVASDYIGTYNSEFSAGAEESVEIADTSSSSVNNTIGTNLGSDKSENIADGYSGGLITGFLKRAGELLGIVALTAYGATEASEKELDPTIGEDQGEGFTKDGLEQGIEDNADGVATAGSIAGNAGADAAAEALNPNKGYNIGSGFASAIMGGLSQGLSNLGSFFFSNPLKNDPQLDKTAENYVNGLYDITYRKAVRKTDELLGKKDPNGLGIVVGKNAEAERRKQEAKKESDKKWEEWQKKINEGFEAAKKAGEDALKGFVPETPGGGSGGKSGGGKSGSGGKSGAEKAQKVFDKLIKITDYADKEIGMFNNHWALGLDTLGNVEPFQASKDALELLALQLYETSLAGETADERAKRMAKSTPELLEDVKKAYQSYRDELKKTIEGQVDMFKAFDFGKKIRPEEMLKNQQSNLRALTEYRQSIQTLAERGISKDILQNFKNRGLNALADMSTLIQMNDEQFKQFNDDWLKGAQMIDDVTKSYMSSIAFVNAGSQEGFKQILDPETGEETGTLYMQSVLNGMRETAGLNLQEGKGVSEATKEIAEGLVDGITETLTNSAEADTAEAASEELGTNLAESVGSSATSEKSETVGKNIVEGVAKGIRDNKSIAIEAAVEMAVEALEAAKNALGIASPSKAFMELGYYSDEGLAQGFTKYGAVVREAAAETAYSAVDELTGVFGRIADIVDGNIDLDPTIRPVLDLTNLQFGASQIGSLLGLNDPYALNAVGTISGIQNDASLMAGLAGSLTDAINGMKTENEIPPVTINIYPTENQSAEEIAEVVSWKLNHDVLKRRAVYGGT